MGSQGTGWISLKRVAVIATTVTLTACGGGSGSDGNPPDTPLPPLSLVNFQAADVVIGQQNMGTDSPDLSATTLDAPYGSPALFNGALYVSDYYNNRLLGFDGIPQVNGDAAAFVYGQSGFAVNSSNTTSDGLSGPRSLAFYNGKLYLSDFDNNRLLVFNDPPTEGNASTVEASEAFGQPDLDSNNSGCSQSELSDPDGLSVSSNGTLVLADASNNRVLLWNDVSSPIGDPDLVLGQANFSSCGINRGGSVDANTLYDPYGVWTDGTRLIVSDSGNERVLIWETMPQTNGEAADYVLGQPDMTSDTANTGADSLNIAYSGLDVRGTQLAVGDGSNNRVLIWNDIPSSNGAPADVVLGQGDFQKNTENDQDQDGSAEFTPDAHTMNEPNHVKFIGQQLFVTDTENHRILIFNGQ